MNGMNKFKNVLQVLIMGGIALGCMILGFLILGNLYIALVYGLIGLLVFQFGIQKRMEKVKKHLAIIEEFQHLANSLILQLSTTPVLDSFIKIAPYFKNEIKEILENEEATIEDKLNYFEQRYTFNLYQIFRKLLEIFIEQGGNILTMSLEMLTQIDYFKVSAYEIYYDNSKKRVDVLILWGLAILCILVLRFTLQTYYIQIMQGSFYFVMLGFLLFFMIAMFLLYRKYAKVETL
jgi:hypothetical protein